MCVWVCVCVCVGGWVCGWVGVCVYMHVCVRARACVSACVCLLCADRGRVGGTDRNSCSLHASTAAAATEPHAARPGRAWLASGAQGQPGPGPGVLSERVRAAHSPTKQSVRPIAESRVRMRLRRARR
jgi:hypothetical protein